MPLQAQAIESQTSGSDLGECPLIQDAGCIDAHFKIQFIITGSRDHDPNTKELQHDTGTHQAKYDRQ
jgi:hypothetical protein